MIRGCITKGKYNLEKNQITIPVKIGFVFEDYALRTYTVIPEKRILAVKPFGEMITGHFRFLRV